MKRSSLLLAILILSSPVWAQKLSTESEHFNVYMGPLQERERGMSVDFFLGSDDDAFYTFFSKGKELTYGKYSNELKKIKENTIAIPKEKVLRNTEMFLELDDDIFEFYSISDTKGKTNKLYARTLNKQTLVPNKDEKELFTLKAEKFYKNFANAFTQIDRSPDGSKFLVAFKLPEEEDRFRRFKFMVFDRQFNLLYETEQKFFINKDLKFRVVNQDWLSAGGGGYFFRMANTGSYRAFQLGNDGEILTWGVQDKGKGFEHPDRLETYLFKITKDKMVNTRIGFSEKKIMQFNIRLTKDGKVMVSGFYNNDMKAKHDLIDGAFLSYWNVEKGVAEHVSFDDFTEEFKTSYWDEKKMEKYEKEKAKGKDKAWMGMSNYDLDHVIEKEDGGALLVGESFYTYTVTIGKTTRTYYVHGNIIVINVDPDGAILWSRMIPKYQVNSTRIGLGYELAWTNDKLYFIFNDNFKNLKDDWNGRVYAFAAGDNPVTLATCDIGNGGEITRKMAWTTDKAGGMFQPGSKVDQLFDNEVVVYIHGGKGSQRLIRVELK